MFESEPIYVARVLLYKFPASEIVLSVPSFVKSEAIGEAIDPEAVQYLVSPSDCRQLTPIHNVAPSDTVGATDAAVVTTAEPSVEPKNDGMPAVLKRKAHDWFAPAAFVILAAK